MKKNRYTGIVIGCGAIGARWDTWEGRTAPRSHAGALARGKRTELVALVDSDRTRLKEAGIMFPRTRLYLSAEEAIKKEKPDIVVIATPPKTHISLIQLAVRSGVKMIICEKPLAPSAREATSLRKVFARPHSPVFVLNYQRRFWPLFKRVRADIANKNIGRIQQVACYYSNGLYNNAGHTIDAILFLLNERITKVSGVENTFNPAHPDGDINIDGILETKSGIRIALQSFDQRAYAIHHMQFFGTKGAIKLLDHGFSAEWSTIKGDAVIPVFTVRHRAHNKVSFMQGALNEAIRCYEKKTRPVSGLTNGMEVIAVLDALRRSAAKLGKEMLVRYS